MRFVRLLLIGCLAASCGCAAWPQAARSNAPIPGTQTDPFRSGDPGPVLPDPTAWVWPRVQLGQAVSTPPERAIVRSAPVGVPAAPVAVPAVTAKPAVEPQWLNEFESTQRRPISTAIVGTGTEHILVTGSLSGNDPTSVQALDALLSRLNESPSRLDGRQVVLVRNPHPDGLAEHISVNARGVDLNRNFPSLRFTASPTRETGPHPASEAETRVMLRLIGDTPPARVIHVRSGHSSRMLVTGNAACVELLGQLRSQYPVDVATFDGEFKSGSLEEFAATRLKAQVLVVELPADASSRPETLDALAATVLTTRPTVDRQEPAGSEPVDDDAPVASQSGRNPAALTGAVEQAGPDGEHGYVELLPPPPHFAVDDSTRTESRLYELTPP